MKTKTIKQLRDEFERKAEFCMFDLRRNEKSGEYLSMPTFNFWAGYWECAKENGVIVGGDADFRNRNS